MDFAAFDAQINKLADLILASSFRPDMIIGIARGGWIPSRLLSKYLNVKKLGSYGMSYKDAGRTEIEIYQDILPAPNIDKILVVEDFLESGKSIKHAMDNLLTTGKEIRSAAIGYLPKTIIIPDYNLGPIDQIPKLAWD